MKEVLILLVTCVVLAGCGSTDQNADTSGAATATNAVATPTDSAPIANTTNQPAPADTANNTSIEWVEGTTKDFGKMKEGEKLDVVFKFKNTGSKPLVIASVTPGCGCTVPETPKEPFAPGAVGEIKAAFDSQGKVGMQSKQVTVVTNTSPTSTVLTFNVEVKPKKG